MDNALLGGLSLGQIPIAGSKRLSMKIALGAELYRIGNIPANRAFALVRGNLRLLYAAPDYGNYRYAARKLFGPIDRVLDVDHVLGRELTAYHGFWYTLLVRVDRKPNRSHGSRERPPAQPRRLVLDKFCYTDERILRKVLGLPVGELPVAARTHGYDLVRQHERELSGAEISGVRWALGMNGPAVDFQHLRPIER